MIGARAEVARNTSSAAAASLLQRLPRAFARTRAKCKQSPAAEGLQQLHAGGQSRIRQVVYI
jgi:hypothetical protein